MATGNSPAASTWFARRWMHVSLVVFAWCVAVWPWAASAQQSAELTLRDTLALALERNPELAAFGKERSATEAAILQAGLLPNPILGIAGDNLGNTRKALRGFYRWPSERPSALRSSSVSSLRISSSMLFSAKRRAHWPSPGASSQFVTSLIHRTGHHYVAASVVARTRPRQSEREADAGATCGKRAMALGKQPIV